jgi:7-cyano-7-deazaguanine reductase
METPPQLTILGNTVRHAVEHVEVFPAPAHVTLVKFTNDELASMCPVTQQPDLSTVVIEYVPDQWCVESKSLKLYLWGFRDRAVFAEALAAEIAGEVMLSAKPQSVKVTLTQRPRGGIEVEAVAALPCGLVGPRPGSGRRGVLLLLTGAGRVGAQRPGRVVASDPSSTLFVFASDNFPCASVQEKLSLTKTKE